MAVEHIDKRGQNKATHIESAVGAAHGNLQKKLSEQKAEQERTLREKEKESLVAELENLDSMAESLGSMIFSLRHAEITGNESRMRSDLIEMLRSADGHLQRMLVDTKRQLHHME